MAFSKPIKITTIKEYSTTGAPDSAYPKSSESSIKNSTPESNSYTATGDLGKNLQGNRSEDSFSGNSAPNQSNKLSHTFQTAAAIVGTLFTLGVVVWYLSKMDSNINKIEKDVENHTSRIEELKESVSKALFRIDNLEKSTPIKNIIPEPQKPAEPSKKP